MHISSFQLTDREGICFHSYVFRCSVVSSARDWHSLSCLGSLYKMRVLLTLECLLLQNGKFSLYFSVPGVMEHTALMEEEEGGEKLCTAGRTADRARFRKQNPGFIRLAWLSSYISFDWLHPGNLGLWTHSRMTVQQIKKFKSGSITGLSFSVCCIKPTEIV